MGYSFDEKGHAHTWEGKPLMGTTTLIKKVLPPPLHWWASGKALENLGWLHPRTAKEERLQSASDALAWINELTPEDYEAYLQKCYRNHDEFKKEAGDWGTETHGAIEEAIKEALATNGGQLHFKEYENEAVERFATWGRGVIFLQSEVHVYSKELWLGGIADFLYKKDDEIYMGDTKTSKDIYASQIIQMGLYDAQQEESGFVDKDGNQILPPQRLAGYTVVNIPRAGGQKTLTYRNTEKLKTFAKTLVGAYETLKELENIT